MMAYLVEIYGPGFTRASVVVTKEDAEKMKSYWRRRGMSVDVKKI